MADEIDIGDSGDDAAMRATPNCRDSSTSCSCAPIRLTISANGFASAMTQRVHAGGGRRQAVRRRAQVAGAAAVRHGGDAALQAGDARRGLTGGLDQLFAGLFGGAAAAASRSRQGAIKPFAAGGVIGTPTYFPLAAGGARARRRGRARKRSCRWRAAATAGSAWRRAAAAAASGDDQHRDARRRRLPPLRSLSHRPDRPRGRARPARPVTAWNRSA